MHPMSSLTTRYNPYPTPAYLITNNVHLVHALSALRLCNTPWVYCMRPCVVKCWSCLGCGESCGGGHGSH